jgi:hypothetical protein
MRAGEIQLLKWSYIERKKGYIYLPAKITKEKKPNLFFSLDGEDLALRRPFFITTKH